MNITKDEATDLIEAIDVFDEKLRVVVSPEHPRRRRLEKIKMNLMMIMADD